MRDLIDLERLTLAHAATRAVHVLTISEVDSVVAELLRWRGGCMFCATLRRERDGMQAILTMSQLSRSPYLGKDYSG